jgi:hypothetical protein
VIEGEGYFDQRRDPFAHEAMGKIILIWHVHAFAARACSSYTDWERPSR